MHLNNILAVTDRLRTAFMPNAPARTALPALSDDPNVYNLYERVAALHFAAFVALCGPAPACVNVRCVQVADGKGGPPRPAYLATLSRKPDHASVEWFHAMEAGLSRFGEAGFPECVTGVVEDQSDPDSLCYWTIADTSEVILQACRVLTAEGRLDAVRNLATVVPQHIPARYNPDRQPGREPRRRT